MSFFFLFFNFRTDLFVYYVIEFAFYRLLFNMPKALKIKLNVKTIQ